MNSLRPLITISILGVICLLLYMKINETEPVIPSEVAEWDMSADLGNLDIGGPAGEESLDFGAVDVGPTNEMDPQASAAPTTAVADYDSAPSFGSAPPAYQPVSSSAPPAFDPAAANSTSNSAPVSDTIETEVQTDASVAEASIAGAPVADTTTVETPATASQPSENSKLPPLPALPAIAVGAAAAADAVSNAAKSSEPAINSSFPSTPVESQTPTSTPASNFSDFQSEPAVAPTESMEAEAKTTAGQASLFSATRLAVQSALDRGELSQALLLLSDWYGDPSLSPAEAEEVQGLLGQLAGSVIYSTEHRLEPPYMVQAGERLEDIAQKHNVPWQLLAKINGLSSPDQLQPGQQLKVVRGPFSARIDLSSRKMVLMLDRRYAGQFSIDVEPISSIEEGYWAVNQKLLTPANVGAVGSTSAAPSEERSILLTSTNGATNQVTILRAAGPITPAATDPAGRVIQLKTGDVNDVYDILSLGSQVMIRR